MKGMVQSAAGLVNVPERAHLQSLMSSLINSAGDILACFI
jgi:hypothetical protein